MKIQIIVLLSFLSLMLTFCKHKDEQAQLKSDSVVAEQTKDTTLVTDPATVATVVPEEKDNKNVSWKQEEIASGSAYYKRRYCGGVKPTPEFEKEFSMEHPLASQKIKFVNSADPSDFVITMTDANGHFSAGLHAGSYDYYIVYTAGSNLPPNPNCQKYFEKTYGKITVGSGAWSGFKLLYAFPCDPCSPPKP
ncbi:MAG: hypothetical protein A2W93_01155 [Bacteroidetes bacterium GWF2_43_63]|nr:MAG: hypothetical protein A2W94_10915 [Bacteroidetes bacterium GWE2_42_42]OFY55686.1 MAG: hypothetical protein A2W93_01155 [Bacteroidetes bacterium GWF2_43_63]HBG69507.1 hypothetical protein [Bacteroidales bacterium]HCB61326.1 hypothetical protein [Bacteroidales bacterium]HCY24201.1 hypothetical protein [Bacteroidales bacterium]